MEALWDIYTIPQENLDFCATIGQIAREKIAPRSAEIDEQAEYPWDIRSCSPSRTSSACRSRPSTAAPGRAR